MSEFEFHRGDLVEVKGPREILLTLDERGTLEGLPFMPEMIGYCGRRFTVERRADKVCDTVGYSGSRRLPGGVLLDDLRCDGSGHDGCQAECRLFWKSAWLRPVTWDTSPPEAYLPSDVAALLERTAGNTRSTVEVDGRARTLYRCQNTELPRCTEHLSVWDPRPYIREYTSQNVSWGRFLRVTARAAVTEPMRKLGLVPEVHLPGTASKAQAFPVLDLQPGEWVRVKSREEIARTLTPDGEARGCGSTARCFPTAVGHTGCASGSPASFTRPTGR